MVWDIGTYEVMDGNYWQGKLHLFFHGKKLTGEWVLVHIGRSDGKKQGWRLIKAGASMKPLRPKQDDRAALTRRTMATIAAARDAEWHSNRNAGAARKAPAPPDIDFDTLPETEARFIEPMQCRPVDKLPEGGEWLYEIKLDGYRCLAVKRDKEASLYSRNRKSFDKTFSHIARALAPLEPGTVLDGEVAALDAEGRPSFNVLQNRPAAAKIFYYVFDVPIYRGKSLFGVPLEKRRRLLESVVARLGGPVRLSEVFAGTADNLTAAARNLHLEGLVAKRKGSNYEPGRRSGAWTKHSISQGQEFVVGGYIPGPDGFQSLLAGYYDGDKLLFSAKIKDGFVPPAKREIAARFKALETDNCPFANLPEKKGARRGEALTAAAMKRCSWLRPGLVVQIEFADWTAANHLRHARFVGLRDDKPAREVVREYPPAGAGLTV